MLRCRAALGAVAGAAALAGAAVVAAGDMLRRRAALGALLTRAGTASCGRAAEGGWAAWPRCVVAALQGRRQHEQSGCACARVQPARVRAEDAYRPSLFA